MVGSNTLTIHLDDEAVAILDAVREEIVTIGERLRENTAMVLARMEGQIERLVPLRLGDDLRSIIANARDAVLANLNEFDPDRMPF